MPLYQYHCEACGSSYEAVESIKADPNAVCVACTAPKASRVLFPPTVFDATPRTLGSQADRNEGPGRRYWVDKQRHDLEASRAAKRDRLREMYPGMVSDASPEYERPYWRDSDAINTKLNELTPKEKMNYILTGNSAEPITPSI